jgi:hypothetical protein
MKFACGNGTADVESQVGARVFLGEPHVVNRPKVEQLWVILQPSALAGERAPEKTRRLWS